MELAFEDKLLRTVCENEDTAKEQFGMQVANKLKARIADLIAAKNVSDLLVGNPQEINSNPHSIYKIDLCDGYCMYFGANHIKLPFGPTGKIEWSNVKRVKILKIEK